MRIGPGEDDDSLDVDKEGRDRTGSVTSRAAHEGADEDVRWFAE